MLYFPYRNLSWLKIFNVDQRYEANRIDGEFFFGSSIISTCAYVTLYYRSLTSKACVLRHEHSHPTSLYLPVQSKRIIHISNCYILCFQHGESVCNLFGRIGGDADLSERGLKVCKCCCKDYNDYF